MTVKASLSCSAQHHHQQSSERTALQSPSSDPALQSHFHFHHRRHLPYGPESVASSQVMATITWTQTTGSSQASVNRGQIERPARSHHRHPYLHPPPSRHPLRLHHMLLRHPPRGPRHPHTLSLLFILFLANESVLG
ncbi:hypothetical protein ACFX11_012167 [Malus domestica]